MAERPKAAVLKTVGRASAPWVRILLPPPYFPMISTIMLVRLEARAYPELAHVFTGQLKPEMRFPRTLPARRFRA